MNDTAFLEKEDLYSRSNVEDVTDADYAKEFEKELRKRVRKKLGDYQNLDDYQDLYVQSDKLLLADVFENFRKMYLKIYGFDAAHFLSSPGIAWQAPLKKTKVKLDLLTDIDMFLVVEKGIRRGICHSFYWYTKANKKCMKYYDKNKESSYVHYWDVNNLFGWAMSQKLPEKNFKWVKVILKFNKVCVYVYTCKSYKEESDKQHFLEADVEYPENLYNLPNDLPFLYERMKIDKAEKLVANLHDKTEYVNT